jgi:hypothetical protein
MSEIIGDLARVRESFEKPTLALLGRKWAAIVLTILTSTFSRERESIPADMFHVQVETYLGELRANGEDVPTETARALSRKWTDDKWLVLSVNDKEEAYSLTSYSQEAIDYVNRLSSDRSMFSESRIRTILEAAQRCAMSANPDRAERVERLDRQIAQLTAERSRITEGGDVEAATEDRMIEEYLNLKDLIGQLPADFMRVAESVKGIHNQIIVDLRHEERRAGEILDAYLERSENLMSSSTEGRAFTGAVELLRDEELLKELSDSLKTILEHSFSGVLTRSEVQDFRNTVSSIRHGIEVVLLQRSRLSATLRTRITGHDPLRDKELDTVLRQAQIQLAAWMAKPGHRTRVGVDLGLPSLDIKHLKTRFYDPAHHAPPPALVDNSGEAGETISLEDLRNQGGPNLRELRASIKDALERSDQDSLTAEAIFAGGPDSLKRPVEILGLIQIASDADILDFSEAASADVVETVRSDGSRRSFKIPSMKFRLSHLAKPETQEGEINV